MPSFAGVLTEEEIRLILEYFKTAGSGGAAKLDGAQLAKEKGCLACHSLDGSKGVGPSFKGIFGTRVKVLKNGKPEVVSIDEVYLKESIVKPGAAVVEGYQPIMPDADDLPEAELNALVQYIKELK